VHGVTQERVALKFLPKSEISDMGAAERTTTEMQCLVALHHPNIIRLDAHIDTPAHVVLVFELMEGGDMFHYLCDLPGNKLPDEATAKAVFHQIVSGVGHAHNQHIAHRDLKLDNVLMGKDDLDCVKVADFGLSGFYQPGKIERTHCGSLNYIAPEVLQGTASAGPPLDVWGLGVILFAFLCGRLPFDGASSLSGDNGGEARARDRTEAAIRKRILAGSYRLDDWVSAEAKDLIRRMLRSDPDERASIPEIFSHCWLRTRNLSSLDLQPQTFFGLGGNSNHARPSSPLTSPRLSPLGIEEKQTSAAKKCLSATSPRLRLAPLDRSAEEKEDTGTCSLQQQSVKESCSPRPQPLSPSYHSEAKPIHYLDDFGSKDGAESSSHRLSRSAHMEPRSPGGTSMLPSIKSPRQAHCSSSPRLSSPQSDRTGPRFFPPQSPHSPTGQRSSYFVSDAADGKASGPPARLSEGSSDRDDDLPAVTPQRSWRGSNKGNGGGGRQLSPISAAETSTLSSTDSLSDSKDDQDVRSSPLSRQKRLIPGRGAKDLFPEVDADQVRFHWLGYQWCYAAF
jgi:serine/threonine protein kinase